MNKVPVYVFIIAIFFVGYFSFGNMTKSDGIYDDPLYKSHRIEATNTFTQTPSYYLVYYFNEKCNPCETFHYELKKYQENPNSYPIYTVDARILDTKSYMKQYKIEGSPTVLFVAKVNGVNREVGRAEGPVYAEQLPLKR